MNPGRIYEEKYRNHLRWQESWLDFSAANKADSVELLLSRCAIQPRTIIDVGCGTGAVLLELRRRRIGQQFYAVDCSAEALSSLSSKAPDVHCQQADITQPWTPPSLEFDCVLLSHVIEHLASPASVLRPLHTLLRFKYLIVEVPLEDLAAARFKNLFRNRLSNEAGHVQFFTPGSLMDLLDCCGYESSASRTYSPILSRSVLEEIANQNRFSSLRKAIYTVTNIYGPKYLQRSWSRFYHGHLAVLAQARKPYGLEAART